MRLTSPDLAQEALGIGESVDQRIVRDWQGSVHAEVCGRIRPIERLLVSVLLGYQSSASPDSTVDMQSPDGNRMIFGGGVGWRFGASATRFSFYGDFEGQAIVPRRVVASDFDLGNGTYNLFTGQISCTARCGLGPVAHASDGPSSVRVKRRGIVMALRLLRRRIRRILRIRRIGPRRPGRADAIGSAGLRVARDSASTAVRSDERAPEGRARLLGFASIGGGAGGPSFSEEARCVTNLGGAPQSREGPDAPGELRRC